MTLDEFFARMDQENAQCPGRHTLFPPLTDAELNAWTVEHPQARLSADLLALLRRSNGLGLYQDWYNGEPIYDLGAYVVFPLAKIRRAAETVYGEDDSYVPPTTMAFILGPESSIYYGFDTQTLHFCTLEPILPDENEDLGPRIDSLLERMI